MIKPYKKNGKDYALVSVKDGKSYWRGFLDPTDELEVDEKTKTSKKVKIKDKIK